MSDTPIPEGLILGTVRRDDRNVIAEMPGSTGWAVTLNFEGRTMTVPFTMGSAYDRPPRLDEVIESLASEASSVINDELDEFELSAELCQKMVDQCAELQLLLGDSFVAVVFPGSEPDQGDPFPDPVVRQPDGEQTDYAAIDRAEAAGIDVPPVEVLPISGRHSSTTCGRTSSMTTTQDEQIVHLGGEIGRLRRELQDARREAGPLARTAEITRLETELAETRRQYGRLAAGPKVRVPNGNCLFGRRQHHWMSYKNRMMCGTCGLVSGTGQKVNRNQTGILVMLGRGDALDVNGDLVVFPETEVEA